jgi:hypothetical protein
MITRIWHGATPATKSDEYLNLMRTVAIPDYRSTPGNEGRLRPAPHGGRYRTFSDDHILGVRGGDPRLCWRRHQRGEILRLRQGLPDRNGAVLHALRDVRQLNPHEGRDSLNVAEPIPTLPATTAAPIASGWERFSSRAGLSPAVVQRLFTARCNLISTINRACAKLPLKWRLLTLGTSTEGDEIWRGSPSSAMCQFASQSECFRCVRSLHSLRLSWLRLRGWFSVSSRGI